MQKWGTEGFIVVFKGINQGRDRVLIAIRKDTSSLEILDQLVSNGDGFAPGNVSTVCSLAAKHLQCTGQHPTHTITQPQVSTVTR